MSLDIFNFILLQMMCRYSHQIKTFDIHIKPTDCCYYRKINKTHMFKDLWTSNDIFIVSFTNKIYLLLTLLDP